MIAITISIANSHGNIPKVTPANASTDASGTIHETDASGAIAETKAE